jgi:DNA-binding transcriptional LysR family regulator
MGRRPRPSVVGWRSANEAIRLNLQTLTGPYESLLFLPLLVAARAVQGIGAALHLAATQAGAGVAGLPGFLADTDAKLQRVANDGEPFARDIWMAVHRDLRRSPQVRAVMDFLLKIVGENPAFAISG